MATERVERRLTAILAADVAGIGHRQPNASDVPPSVLQSEDERTEQDKKLDKALDICRGC